LSPACRVLPLLLFLTAVLLHIFATHVSHQFDRDNEVEVVRVTAKKMMVSGFTAAAMVGADVLVNVAVIAGSG
jgi:hypothetical protein